MTDGSESVTPSGDSWKRPTEATSLSSRSIASTIRAVTIPIPCWLAAIRRCVHGIVIDLDQNELRLSLRKLPMILGGSLTTLTETIIIPVPSAI